MQCYFSRVLALFLATVLQRFAAGVCQSETGCRRIHYGMEIQRQKYISGITVPCPIPRASQDAIPRPTRRRLCRYEGPPLQRRLEGLAPQAADAEGVGSGIAEGVGSERQGDLSTATAAASSIRVLLWHVTAAFQGPREPHALTPAAPSHCRSLDVLAWLLEFSASIQEP